MIATTARLVLLALVLSGASAALEAQPAQSFSLATTEHVRPVGVTLAAVEHRGRRAVRVRGAADSTDYQVAILEGSSFKDGTIEAELAGQPAAGAPEGSRGFVGLAFRASADASRFECFYLRPTNGRAEDQLRRNHSTQYISHPGFPWQKLRNEATGVYESYVDLVPGEWTPVRIEVEGRKARLFVGGASQPGLIVNDLKQGESVGAVALWIGGGTEAWFRNVKITAK